MTAAHSRPPGMPTEDLAWRITNEFTEMPGMHLTFGQIKRLWHLSHDDCAMVLDYLMDQGLLTRDAHDRFCRQESRNPWLLRNPHRERSAS